MTDDQTEPTAPEKASAGPGPEPHRKPLTPAAERALAEAEARRREREAASGPVAPEVGGRPGPDPARYGDWEKGGIASDF